MKVKKALAIAAAMILILSLASCQKKNPSIVDLQPYLDDFHDNNKTVTHHFYIPPNIPMDFFEIKGTGTTNDDETVDLFEGKKIESGKSIEFDNAADLKELHIEVNVLISGKFYPGVIWDIDLINNSTHVGLY